MPINSVFRTYEEPPDLKKRAKNGTEEHLLVIHDKMGSWTDFVRDLPVPGDLLPAFTTGRINLIRILAKPRPMTAEEVGQLYDLIGGILETNQALREHSQLVSQLADQLIDGLRGGVAAARRIQSFADFQTPGTADDE